MHFLAPELTIRGGCDVPKAHLIKIKYRRKQKQPAQPNASKQEKKVKKKPNGNNQSKELQGHTLSYLKCLMNPLHSTPVGAPGMYNPPSWKVKTIQRYTVFPGSTTGTGWILAAPSFANDGANVAVTTTGATSTSILATGTGIVAHSNADLPYTSAELTANKIKARVVGACLTLTYYGTELNMNGLYATLCEPNHDSVVDSTFNTLQLYSECRVHRVSHNKVACHYMPRQQDLEFVPTTDLLDDYMVIMVYSSEGQPFYAEFTSIVEYEGKIVRSKTSNQEVDIVKSQKALTVLASNHPTSGIQSSEKPKDSFGTTVLNVAKQEATKLLSTGLETLGSMLFA